MPESRAYALLNSIRWYHLGFCFLWATTFVGLSAYNAGGAGSSLLYGPIEQAGDIAGVSLIAIALMRGVRPKPGLAWVSAALLCVGSVLFFAGPRIPDMALPLGIAAGAAVGGASGMFFVLWQEFYASEGSSRTAICIPLSAASSVVLCFIVRMLPFPISMLLTALVFPLLAGWSLMSSMREIEWRDIGPMDAAAVSGIVSDLWRPAFCVSVLGFVWKLVSGLFPGGVDVSFAVVMGGFALAVMLVVAIEVFAKNGFEILRIYQVLFPVVAGVFLLPTLFGPQFSLFLTGMLMFGFEVANLLLLITCAVYASERNASSAGVYLFCVCPVLVCMLAGDLLGMYLTSQETYSFAVAVDVLFICIYALSIVLVLVSWVRKGRSSAVDTFGHLPSRQEETVAEPIAKPVLFDESGRMPVFPEQIDPLSKREQEVVLMVVEGNNIPAIARKLYISENTVRGHLKSIYRRLGIHSKQEIIDAINR